MNEKELIENMVRWAMEKLGDRKYAGWCLSFIEDALEISNGIEIFGGDCAKESAELYADAMMQGEPLLGAFVFYDCLCLSENGPVNWGHCGISLGDGKVIHAWDVVRIDMYRDIEKLTATSGDHPRYIGWVPVSRVLTQKQSSFDKLRAAINKKSFELNYNGGTIWCEHLDGMGDLEQEVIDKFKGDLPKLRRPSVSSSMIINLDDTVITEAIENEIVNVLLDSNKQFRKIAFVGVNRRHHTKFNEIHDRTGALVKYLNDYEKAKEWVL